MNKILKSEFKLELFPDMDMEVVELVRSMNAIPGIETDSSCCGHDEMPVVIYFKASRSDGLFFLARCVNKRYFKYTWNITLMVGDVYKEGDYPVIYVLTNKSTGEEAYKEIQALIDNMNLHLNHEIFMNNFKLNTRDFITVEASKALFFWK